MTRNLVQTGTRMEQPDIPSDADGNRETTARDGRAVDPGPLRDTDLFMA